MKKKEMEVNNNNNNNYYYYYYYLNFLTFFNMGYVFDILLFLFNYHLTQLLLLKIYK